MIQPHPGDVFNVLNFPFDDDIFGGKDRPVIVLRDEGNGLFLVAPVTGTNLTGIRSGLWITKNSTEGRSMNLDKDSFVVADKSMKWPSYALVDYRGHCSFVSEILAKIK